MKWLVLATLFLTGCIGGGQQDIPLVPDDKGESRTVLEVAARCPNVCSVDLDVHGGDVKVAGFSFRLRVTDGEKVPLNLTETPTGWQCDTWIDDLPDEMMVSCFTGAMDQRSLTVRNGDSLTMGRVQFTAPNGTPVELSAVDVINPELQSIMTCKPVIYEGTEGTCFDGEIGRY